MMSLAACVTGFFLDRLFGDPVCSLILPRSLRRTRN